MFKLPQILRLRLSWGHPRTFLAFTMSLEAQPEPAVPGNSALSSSDSQVKAPAASGNSPTPINPRMESEQTTKRPPKGSTPPIRSQPESRSKQPPQNFRPDGKAASGTKAAVTFPPAIFEQEQISIKALRETGIPLEETTYLAVGGGLGSFTWVDHLVIHGVDPAQIKAIGFEEKPYARCRRLCRNSQIPDHERLRSDSGGTPDNIWGWPGYALREIWADLKSGQLGHAAALAWQIFSEPVLAEPFTPKAGQVFRAIDREAQRIGWPEIWRFGRVRAIRKTDDGRYVVAYSQSTWRKRRPRLMLASYIHLSLGYPRLRLLPDLQSYRAQTGDCHSFVNAYEPHDHLYRRLRWYGGVVLIRGRGIVASRIIQRLYEERLLNPKINILHLMRGPNPARRPYQRARRLSEHHFQLQPYNFPKATFGGDLAFVMAQAGEEQRSGLIDAWGGTTTAKRRAWQQIIKTGLAQGWYHIRFGQLNRVERSTNGKLKAVIQGLDPLQEEVKLYVDFIVDATGLEADPDRHPLLKDIRQTYRLKKNPKGRLNVSQNFELIGMQNGRGRIYASGAMTLGGPYAPVDSFTGLQYAAQCSLDELRDLGAPGLRAFTPLRSVIQWLRWAGGFRP